MLFFSALVKCLVLDVDGFGELQLEVVLGVLHGGMDRSPLSDPAKVHMRLFAEVFVVLVRGSLADDWILVVFFADFERVEHVVRRQKVLNLAGAWFGYCAQLGLDIIIVGRKSWAGAVELPHGSSWYR